MTSQKVQARVNQSMYRDSLEILSQFKFWRSQVPIKNLTQGIGLSTQPENIHLDGCNPLLDCADFRSFMVILSAL